MAPKAPVDKTFRPFAPEQGLLLPPSLDDWLPAEHLARFIAELVDEHLDLSRIHAAYTEVRGGPPYDPRLLVRILLYGYTTGVRSSRKLEAAVHSLPRFPWEPQRETEPSSAPLPVMPPRRAPSRQDPGDAQGQQ